MLFYPVAFDKSDKDAILPATRSDLTRQHRRTCETSHCDALPSRFRRERVLLIGCGDVGMRVAGLLRGRVALLALTSSAGRVAELRASGIRPLLGNLDDAASIRRLAGLATRLVHLAPPAGHGAGDRRTLVLTRALRRQRLPRSLVYGSTSGVYGDCDGQVAIESRATSADTARARRRIDAETMIRRLGRASNLVCSILRIPGIYASDRAGGTPHARLKKGTPVLDAIDDVFTNHIHSDDLARACVAALWRGRPGRVYNINDDTCLKMGDYFDLAADLYGLPKPPRITRRVATETLPALQLSFMSESRRMNNRRMKTELRLRLRYPTVMAGLRD
jgi:nucleoside-diphosphate-sugar epimerase